MLYKQLSLFFKCTILWELLLIDLVFKIIFQMKAYFIVLLTMTSFTVIDT